MADHRKHWRAEPDPPLTAGQRRAADAAMDRHVAQYPRCRDADVCVHNGLIFTTSYCVTCGRVIG